MTLNCPFYQRTFEAQKVACEKRVPGTCCHSTYPGTISIKVLQHSTKTYSIYQLIVVRLGSSIIEDLVASRHDWMWYVLYVVHNKWLLSRHTTVPLARNDPWSNCIICNVGRNGDLLLPKSN